MPEPKTLRGPISAAYCKHREIERERRERIDAKVHADPHPDVHAAHKQYVHAFFELLRTRAFIGEAFDEHGAHITGSFFVHEVLASAQQDSALFQLRISTSGILSDAILVSVVLSTSIMYHRFE
jgi:hypothetical protein